MKPLFISLSFLTFLSTAAFSQIPNPITSPGSPTPASGGSTLEEEIVVTASAMPEATGTVPASVTAITREEIASRESRDVADVLREVPGLQLSRSGSSGKATSLFTRGGDSNHTLVLWNGIEINNPYFGGYDWGRFSTAGVEQIEVVRGPYSALYGSDSMSGVVNIVTIPGRSGFGVNLTAGENGLFNGSVEGAFVSGTMKATASAERRDDQGWFENDDFSQDSVNAGLSWTAGGFSVGAQGRFTSYDLGVPFNIDAAGTVIVPSLLRRQDGDELQLAIPVRLTLGRVSYEMTLAQVEQNDSFDDPNDPFGFTFSDTQSTTRRVNGVARVDSAFGTLIGGAEFERSEVEDTSVFGPNLTGQSRSNRSFFFEDRYSRPLASGSTLELSVGARHDSFETFGSELSPRAGIAWVSGANKIRASYGEGFRAPSIGELYAQAFGANPDLQPERSRNLELGFDRRHESAEISITLFRSEYDDLIEFDNASFTFQNIGAAESRGIELAIGGRSDGGFRTGASYTYLDTEELATGAPLLRRARHSGSANIGFERSRFEASLIAIHTGERPDFIPVSPYSRVNSSAYTIFDATFRFPLGNFVPFVKIENMMDEEYEEVRGYPSPGRRALIGLRYSLR